MPRGRAKVLQSASRADSVSTISKNRTASEQPVRTTSFPPAIPPAPLSPLVAQLRRDYRWASISQFLFSFGHAVGVSDEEGDIEALEADLDAPREDELVPKLIVKLLYALTYDKKINIENFETKLRNQYVLRDPRRNPFGKEQELSRRWNQLGLGEKVEAFYNCCEWLWADPARFRALLNNEDDAVQWRIEPCGWDKSGNTYWLFDDNRLWVQHPPPTPPKPIKPPKKPVKGKAKPNVGRRKGYISPTDDEDEEGRVEPPQGRKARYRPVRLDPESDEMEDDAVDSGPSTTRKRGRLSSETKPTTTRYGRTSKKVQAAPMPISGRAAKKLKLSSPTHGTDSAPARGRSTRASRRSGIVGDEWEPIPEEWLRPDAAKAVNGKKKFRPDDDESELSELSDAPSDNERDTRMESDLTSISSSTLSDVDDLPEGGDEARPSVIQEEADLAGKIEPESGADAISDEVEKSEHLDAEAVNVQDLQTPMDIDLSASLPTSIVQPSLVVTSDTPVPPLNTTSDVQGDNDVSLQQQPITEVTTADDGGAADSMDVVVQETVDHAVGNDATAVHSAHPQIPDDPVVEHASAAQGQTVPSKVETEPTLPLQQEPTNIPESGTEQKANGPDDKTVLEELSEEIAEAQEEEEDDPNDEVRAIIRRARNPDYLEWELASLLVCASRYEWEMFPKQFEQSRNPDEKAFYRHLVNNILPGVLAAHREKEIRRAQEEAIRNRKRSSRLVMKELEREAQRKEEETIRLVEERMQRVRDEEARREAEELDRIHKEREREDRLREREERIREREERLRYRELEDIHTKDRAEKDRETRFQQRRDLGFGGSGSRPGSRQPSEAPSRELRTRGRKRQSQTSPERWEVACEICNRHGWNIDEDRPIVSCELCERWQHIDCYDRFDKQHGRQPRKWSNINFYCSECTERLAEGRARAAEQANVATALLKSPDGPTDMASSPNGHQEVPTSPMVHRSPRITIPAYAHGRSPVLMKAQPQLLPTSGALQAPSVDATADAHACPPASFMPSGSSAVIGDPVHASTPSAAMSQIGNAPSILPNPSPPQLVVAPPDDTKQSTSNSHQDTPSGTPRLPIVVRHGSVQPSLAPAVATPSPNGAAPPQSASSHADLGPLTM